MHPNVSKTTREAVRAEPFASQKRGDWILDGDAQRRNPSLASMKSRAEVQAEALTPQNRLGNNVFQGDGLLPRAAS